MMVHRMHLLRHRLLGGEVMVGVIHKTIRCKNKVCIYNDSKDDSCHYQHELILNLNGRCTREDLGCGF